jgi:hypothetical protein
MLAGQQVKKEKSDLIIIDGVDIWLPFVIPLKFLKIPLLLDIRSLNRINGYR